MNDPAIVALTSRGWQLAARLQQSLGQGEVILANDGARHTLECLFRSGRPLVCIMALGIVVRLVGPLAQDKETDPPVVVVDEAGRFAISVLGGHEAGANALARQVARALDAVPVITTASDSLGLPAVDLIGRDWGWKIEGREHLTKVAAAVVRGEPIAVYQTAGREDWWRTFGDWPPTFQHVTELPQGEWAGLLVISDRVVPGLDRWPALVYRPPTLAAGVGCKRGVPCAEIEALFQEVCGKFEFAPLSLGLVATASLKADEPGLLEFAAAHGVPLRSYSLEELGAVPNLPTPSEQVRARIGILGVAEPAALLAASSDTLLVPKQRGPRTTLALARRNEA